MRRIAQAGALAGALGSLLVAGSGDSLPRDEELEPPIERGRVSTGEYREALRPAEASFRWSMPERYERSWDAWEERRSRYDPSFVEPERWSVRFDACSSSGVGSRIAEYRWRVEGADRQGFGFERTTRGCRYFARGRFPELGTYRVTLSIETAAGTTDEVHREIELEDHLIVSLGDSLSSGEGNPDRPGEYRFSRAAPKLARCKGEGVERERTVRWKDRRCHRSALSGPALAAERIEERDDHSSVTFLSFACSGAQIRHLFRDRYAGQEPPPRGRATVPPQLDALGEALGGRHIDALLLSVGINDLSFSEKVKGCITNSFDVAGCGRGIFDTLDELPDRYRALDRAIRRFDVGEIYVVDYPVNVLENEGGRPDVCECLELAPQLDLQDAEVTLLTQAGVRLNRQVGFAANQEEIGWSFVHGMPAVFEGGGYCTPEGDRLFRKRLESIRMQGPEDGAMHPNLRGHHRLKALLLDALVLDPPEPRRRVTVTFEKVKLSHVERRSSRPASVRFRVLQREKKPFRDLYNPFRAQYVASFGGLHERGRWVELPEGEYRFEFELYPSPAPPRYITDFGVEAEVSGKSVGEPSHVGMDDHGAGRHLVETPDRVSEYVGLQYRVDLRPVVPTTRGDAVRERTMKLERRGTTRPREPSRRSGHGARAREHRSGEGQASPSASCSKPTLYEHSRLRGGSLELTESVADLHARGFGDAASSLCVPPGWRVMLYEDRDFRGASYSVSRPGPRANLHRAPGDREHWGDRASSVRVVRSRGRRDP